MNLSSVLRVKSAYWSTRNFCSIYLLSLGVNNMSKLLSDQLNVSQKCTKTSSVDSCSQDTAVRGKHLERERERERANFSTEKLLKIAQIVENQSIMVS